MPVYVDGEQVSGGGPPSGAAGGALAGTYPSPTLNPADTAGDAVLKGTLTTAGDLLGASAANTPARVVPAAAGTVLTSNGAGVASTFQAVPAGAAIPKSVLTAIGDIVSASAVGTPAVIPATTAGLILTANGTGVQSTYQTNAAIATANAAIPKALVTAVGDLVSASAAGVPVVIPAVAAGRLLRAAGVATLPAYSTLIIPNDVAQGDILIASTASNLTALAAGAADTFVGGNGTVPQARTAAQARASLGVVAPIRFGNQTGGDTTWTGWTLGVNTAIVGGAIQMTNNNGILTAYPLVGAASPRAIRLEWHLIPRSTWDTSADIIYLGTARTALSQYWYHRALGDGNMSAWVQQPLSGAAPQPGVTSAGGPSGSGTNVIWQALEISSSYVIYQYGTGTGTLGRTPPAPSEWKTYGMYLLSTYTGLTSPQAETFISVLSDGSCVVDLDALTICPLSPLVS